MSDMPIFESEFEVPTHPDLPDIRIYFSINLDFLNDSEFTEAFDRFCESKKMADEEAKALESQIISDVSQKAKKIVTEQLANSRFTKGASSNE